MLVAKPPPLRCSIGFSAATLATACIADATAVLKACMHAVACILAQLCTYVFVTRTRASQVRSVANPTEEPLIKSGVDRLIDLDFHLTLDATLKHFHKRTEFTCMRVQEQAYIETQTMHACSLTTWTNG